MKIRPPSIAALLAFALIPAAGAADLELISRVEYPAGGTQPGIAGDNYDAALQERRSFSADSRYFVFESRGTALVPGVLDLNGNPDIFLFDRQTRTTTLISHAPGQPLVAGRGAATTPLISADGRYVFFRSTPLLSIGWSTLSGGQIYRYDRATGVARLVSHQAGMPGVAGTGECRLADISSDGSYAAFHSFSPSSQLVPGTVDTNPHEDLFLWDAATDSIALLTRKVDFPNETPGLGAGFLNAFVADDGRTAYRGPRRLAIAADGGPFQAFLYEPAGGAISLVSRSAASPGAAAGAASTLCDFSPDGRYLLFQSAADDLVAGVSEANQAEDLFLYDRQSGAVELISAKAAQPSSTGDGRSTCGQLSNDGRYVYFPTLATDLVAGVTGGAGWDMVRRDRQAGTTALVSRSAASPSVAAGGVTVPELGLPGPVWAITPDGSSLLFASSATDLAPGTFTGSPRWSYRWDNPAEAISLAATAADGSAPASFPQALSPDGEAGVFATAYPGQLAGVPHPAVDAPQQLVLREGGANTLLAAAAFAGRGSGSVAHENPIVNDFQLPAAQVSASGGKVAFLSVSNEICGAGRPLCLVDREAGGQAIDIRHRWDDPQVPVAGDAFPLQFSQDGGKLLLASKSEGYAPNDFNDELDLFLYDLAADSYELISHAAGTPGTAGNRGATDLRGYQSAPMMTADASRIVFSSRASNYVDPGGTITDGQIYLADRAAATIRLVSHRAGDPALGGSNQSNRPQISADGKFALFLSHALDLIPGFVDANNTYTPDIYLYDLTTGSAALVSHVAGLPARAAVHPGYTAFLSADGRFVTHSNDEMFMMIGATDANQTYDVFRYDRATGENTLVSHAAGNRLLASNGSCYPEGMSQNGRFVLMRCTGSDLVKGVSGPQLYLWDGNDGSIILVSHRSGSPATPIGDIHTSGLLTADGGKVYFTSAASNAVPGLIDRPDSSDVFIWERTSRQVSLLTSRFGASSETADGQCLLGGQGAPAGEALLLTCSSPALLPYDNNPGPDLFLALLPQALFADGFESGSTAAWSQ